MSSVYLKPANVAKFVTLPGIFPRLKHLLGGFDYIPFLMAQVFGLFGLLPAAHPYLQNANIGRFGVAKLLAASSQSFAWNRENTDKIILYLTSVAGVAIIALMFIAGILYLSALPVWASDLFITPYPNTDIAFRILNKVIGVPGIYGTSLTTPDPFHSAIHAMLRMYSSALFAFAFVYLLYYIFSIVAETAITGTPFGKRFHKVYGPVRLVTAIGLLLPFGSYGLNSAQYIVLYAAKWGSGVATNAWIAFNQVSAQPFGYGKDYTAQFPPYSVLDQDMNVTIENPGEYRSRGLMAVPRVPNAAGLGSMIGTIHTCQLLYKAFKPQLNGRVTDIKPYLAKARPNTSVDFLTTDFETARQFYQNNDVDLDIVVYFGQYDERNTNMGHIDPVCGSIKIPVTQAKYIGINALREVYYNLIQEAFRPAPTDLYVAARGFAEVIVARSATEQTTYPTNSCASTMPTVGGYPRPMNTEYSVAGPCNGTEENWAANHIRYFASQLNAKVAADMYPALRRVIEAETLFEIPQGVYEYGWGGAGIWFNRISELNSDVFQSLHALPEMTSGPPLLQRSLDQGTPMSEGLAAITSFFGDANEVRTTSFIDERDRHISRILLETWNYWASDETNTRPATAGTDNAFIQAIAFVFGATPILTIRDDTGVHPFAQLTGIGKGLIEKAITALTIAGGLSFGEGLITSIPDEKYQSLAGFFRGKAGLLKAVAFVGLTAGFIMYYIIPFMPFLYFFFAVSGWVKSILEAMVGAPLWALSHMRLEGDSFLSKQSLSGYYMTLEIFIRPVLILFGLFAASSLFASLVLVLNMMFDLVTVNMTGIALDDVPMTPDQAAYYRSVLDQLFFLVMYVIIVYLLSSVCFKMTDEVPNNITRWMSAGIKSFGDMAKDPAEQLTTYASMAGYKFAPQISEMVMDTSRTLGNVAGGATNRTGRDGQPTNAVKDFVDGALGIRQPAAGAASTASPDAGQQTPPPETPQPRPQGDTDRPSTRQPDADTPPPAEPGADTPPPAEGNPPAEGPADGDGAPPTDGGGTDGNRN